MNELNSVDMTKTLFGPSQLTPYQLFYLPLGETLPISPLGKEEEETGRGRSGRVDEREERPEGKTELYTGSLFSSIGPFLTPDSFEAGMTL